MAKGRVIAIDGPDGVGKSTQVKLLADKLTNNGFKVHVTRSSGGTPIGRALRSASLTNVPRHVETDLYISLAMGVDLGFDIKARKAEGETIIIDRSPLAIIAYQVYASRLPDEKAGFTACQKQFRDWQIDDLIILDADETTLKKRRQNRGKEDRAAANNYFERQEVDYHKRTQAGYRAGKKFVCNRLKTIKVYDIDAKPDIASVHSRICMALGL